MKKLFFIGILLICACLARAQTIRRVNSNPHGNDSPLVYPTAQAAIDASVDGDVIYLEPAGDVGSGVNYGAMNITKRLTIYGNGYLLNRGNPNLPFDKRPVSVDGITLGDSSAYSTLVGLDCNAGITILDSNITLNRCIVRGSGIYLSGPTVPNLKNLANNITIIGCYLVGNLLAQDYPVGSSYVAGRNVTCKNNIITGTLHNLRNSTITNNVFSTDGYTSTGYTINTLGNSVVKNNIIDARRNIGSYEFVRASIGNTITNNVCAGYNGLPAGNGNINAANPTTTFVIQDPFAQLAGPYTSNEQGLKIPNGSVAKIAGEGSTEAGAFGGSTPYVPSGIPPVPLVTSYTNNGSAHTAASLTFTINVKTTN